jgi:hypothetical protein
MPHPSRDESERLGRVEVDVSARQVVDLVELDGAVELEHDVGAVDGRRSTRRGRRRPPRSP